MNARDNAIKLYREWSDHGWGDCHCQRCLRDGPINMRDAITQALEDARTQALEEAAEKLDAAAEHHACVDKDPAWDDSRVGVEPCEEHGHVYHSYPGYSAHVLAQMAKVVRALIKKDGGV